MTDTGTQILTGAVIGASMFILVIVVLAILNNRGPRQ